MMGRYYIDEKTGKVHILIDPSRTHEECVQSELRKKRRKAAKYARRRNRGKR